MELSRLKAGKSLDGSVLPGFGSVRKNGGHFDVNAPEMSWEVASHRETEEHGGSVTQRGLKWTKTYRNRCQALPTNVVAVDRPQLR